MTAKKRRGPKKASETRASASLPTHYDVWVSQREKARVQVATMGQKREAIREARRIAYGGVAGFKNPPRQVSVYVHTKPKRPTLVYQVHFSPMRKRLIAEEL